MAEIVRLLRWRAEWDGADLVDGAGKAAAAGERLKKSLDEVGAAGPAALKKTSVAAKEADGAFEGLGLEAQQVLKYVKALESGAGSPLVMKRNAELAEAAFNVLAQSAGKAGKAIPEAFSDRVIVAIQKATTQAAGMNAELEKMGGLAPTKLDKVITALDKTAQSGERAARAVGDAAASTAKYANTAASSAGATERLGDTIRKSTEGVTKFKGAALEAWGALALGKMIGEGLAKAIDKTDASMAAHDKRMSDAAVNTIKFQSAMKLAEAGFLTLGGTQEQFLARYDAYVEKMRAGRTATEDKTRALAEQAAALKHLDEIAAAVKGTAFTILSPEDADAQLNGVRALAKGIEDALSKAFKAGGEEERARWATANEEAVQRVVAAFQKAGIEIPAHIRAVSDAQKAGAADATEWARQEAAAYDVLEAAATRRRAAEEAASNRTSRAPQEFKAIQDAAFGAAVASGEFGTNLDRVAEAVVATGGSMTVGVPYLIQYAAATRDVTRALLDRAKAERALREEQVAALESTKGWTDYLLTLKEGYESGTTSLYNYKTALGEFKTQILQLFAGAKGEAKEAVEAILDLIRQLERSATGGKARTSGPVGWLDDAVGRGKG